MQVFVPSTKGIRLEGLLLFVTVHTWEGLHRGRLDVCCAASTNGKWSVGISVVGHGVNVSFFFFFSREL